MLATGRTDRLLSAAACGAIWLVSTAAQPLAAPHQQQAGHNTFGLLTHHVWLFAGDNDHSGVSTTFLQPFFSHTTPSATTSSINTETSYDWKSGSRAVPINLSVAQLTKIGKQPISMGGGIRYYVEKPNDGPEWGIRLFFTLLFPKA